MEHKNTTFDFKAHTDNQGEFSGYAAAFGNVDLVGDRITKGAFKRTIGSSKGRIPVLYQHREPIGQGLTASEDNKGLKVSGQLFLEDDFPEARKAYKLVGRGMIKSMSIGYDVVKFQFVREKGQMVRELLELKLFEYSLVMFPANPAAVLTGMKSEDLHNIQEVLAQYEPSQQKTFLTSLLMGVDPDNSDLSGDPSDLLDSDSGDSCTQLYSLAKGLGDDINDFLDELRKKQLGA